LGLERDRYQRLADRIERVREDERASLARELHDDIGQMLTVLQIDLGSFPTKGRAEDGMPVIERASRVVSEIIRKTRHVATLLRPPLLDQLGVVAAIEWQVNELKKRGNMAYSFRAAVDELPELGADLRVGMFRVAQEALTNAARHSGASKVDIRVYCEKNAAVLEIQDNGTGFNVEEADRKGTLGLTGMEERARYLGAQLTVETETGRGTTVRFSAPLNQSVAGGLVQ
jgi:signal transduction histidine kinase